MNNIFKNMYTMLLIYSLIILSACDKTILNPYIPERNGEIKLNKLTFTDNYYFYEENGSLFFIINLKNNTDRMIEVDKTIQPFGVYFKNKMLESLIIIPSYGEETKAPTFTIEPGKSQNFKFELNEEFKFVNGIHNYELIYLNHFMDVETNGYYDDKYIKTIRFTWSKLPNNKGRLINSDFTP